MLRKAFRVSLVIICVILLVGAAPAWAVFDLTVLPEDGGFDLRFGRLGADDFKIGKQVTVRVTNDTGVEYRVKQRLIEPLRSGEGVALDPEQFRMYPLVNSNLRGSLLTFAESPVNAFDNVLYSSSGTGEGDSFQVVYTLTPQERQVPGSYRGRISYILIPVKSTASQVVVNMDVSVELAAGSRPVVEVRPEAGGERLFLETPDSFGALPQAPQEGATITLRVLTPLGVRYRIFQTFEGMEPTDAEGRRADLDGVSVRVEASGSGVAAAEAGLKAARGAQSLYTSDVNGAPTELFVHYLPAADFWLQKAGTYRGRIRFYLEMEGGSGASRTDLMAIDTVFDIARLFDIYVTSAGREGVSLDFGDVSHKTGPKTSEITIRALANQGRPYQIVQVVGAPMMNEEGEKVPPEDFTVRALQNEGASAFFLLKDPEPVKQGETVVCASDAQGRPAEVTLVYELTMRPDSRGGHYETQLGYSLVSK